MIVYISNPYILIDNIIYHGIHVTRNSHQALYFQKHLKVLLMYILDTAAIIFSRTGSDSKTSSELKRVGRKTKK